MRGFDTAAAGMIAQSRRQQMLTNNLANMKTPGYKADKAVLRSFPEMLISRLGGDTPGAKKVGALSTGVYMQEMIPNFRQGPLEETGKPTDVALIQGNLPVNPETGQPGALFFTVQTADGLRYTRDGHFTIDGQGFLTTAKGQYVLDANGRKINLPSDEFKVLENGTVVVGDTPITKIGIAFAANPNQLTKVGGGLFRLQGKTEALPAAQNNPNVGFQLSQGYLEQSNVAPERTMTDLSATYRAFEANQKVLQAYDRSMEKAVNQVGRIG
ncbi:flagellar basal-body rod protein FlgG [Scopulibacillus darangshiensis]|uniref:Flagellar basal-body rod protein FlgG n=1 Tax=Scopulibacillus darangshiensis TaxID=442528 RepID=A0A4R2NEI4_9BACL|nr:flagellar hook-basal body protein [Scopulibacillus darangshiensis]TCP19522.1 flagellar basal-body rod protein FlgG [Scopulibacillus darangshiensis]